MTPDFTVITIYDIIITAIIIFAPIIIGICMYFINKKNDFFGRHDIFTLVLVSVLAVCFLIGFLIGIFYVVNMINSPAYEHVIYNSMKIEGRTIQEALNASTDVVNSELYLKAINFNSKLSIYEDYAMNPKFAPMRWGMDWQDIPKIIFD